MNCYKNSWIECRGDEYDFWGTSDWYFETGADKWVTRQIEIYANGTVLHYDQKHLEDKYGFLSDMTIDDKFLANLITIEPAEFERMWTSHPPINI